MLTAYAQTMSTATIRYKPNELWLTQHHRTGMAGRVLIVLPNFGRREACTVNTDEAGAHRARCVSCGNLDPEVPLQRKIHASFPSLSKA